jgi:hypothetical protein
MLTGLHEVSRFQDERQTIPDAALGVMRALRDSAGPIATTFENERGRQLRARIPDIGRAPATMYLGIADATLTAAANEITCRYVRQCDGWQRRCNTSRHHPCRKRRLSLKGPAARQLDQVVAMRAISNIRKRMRLIAVSANQTDLQSNRNCQEMSLI